MMTSLLCLLALAHGQVTAAPKEMLKDVETISIQGTGTKEGRAAWERVAELGGPELLPHLLKAMNTPDIVRVNWLRSAFDAILERALTKKGPMIPTKELVDFARDAKNQGRARRFALEVAEKLAPGTTAQLLPGWLNDPEFRFDAVERLLGEAKEQTGKGQKDLAVASYQKAFASSRDVDQARTAAAGLLDLGISVSTAKQLGFLMDWYVIGPFDAPDKKGFATEYPPEKKVDLTEKLPGKFGTVGWKRFQVKEPSPKVKVKHVALVELRDKAALGDADDAVGFAYTEIVVPTALKVEFRGAADDNFIVWVNGKKVFGFEEWQNGVRHDRHRFPVELKAGKNSILVKVCQSPPYLAPNWEFLLRIADETGAGVAFESGLK